MKRTIIIVVLAAIPAAGAFYAVFVDAPQRLKDREAGMSFARTGNLTRTSDGWSLVYEGPGAPALSVSLVLGDDAVCITQGGESNCAETGLVEGARVELRGYREGDTVRVSEISFKGQQAEDNGLQVVQLFYYSPDRDRDASGNVMCSKKGLTPVSASVPAENVIENTIKLLIQGNIPGSAAEQGVTSEFPLEGFELEGSSLQNGVLTLTFSDPGNLTSGGSCRAGILWAQIEQTALQFEGVEEVRFQPEYLFQP